MKCKGVSCPDVPDCPNGREVVLQTCAKSISQFQTARVLAEVLAWGKAWAQLWGCISGYDSFSLHSPEWEANSKQTFAQIITQIAIRLSLGMRTRGCSQSSVRKPAGDNGEGRPPPPPVESGMR